MKRFLVSLIFCALIPGVLSAQWKPAGDHIRTSWAEQVSPSNVHPEYPRPQMVRSSYINLNGLWDYAITAKDAVRMPQAAGQILVPFPLESSLSGVAGRLTDADALWYSREFKIPRKWKKKDVLLHFDAVDWDCEVWLNGNYLGRHKGGYTAFEFRISPYLVKGEQSLVLKVLDGTDNDLQPRGKQVMDPSKGSIWYTAVSGIWQSVWMEAVDKRGYISDYQVEYDAAGHRLKVMPEGLGDGVAKVELLEACIGYDTAKPSSTVLATAEVGEDGAAVFQLDGNEHLWSPDEPYLYGLRISLCQGKEVLDKVEAYTGLRTISVVKDADGHKRMALNGKPLFHYGPLDQGWWPDGLYTAPTDEALKYDLVRTKDYGFNMIRKHIKVEPSRWFYYCDQLGIMVWQDMPCVAKYERNEYWAQGKDVYDAGYSDQLSKEARNNFRLEWTSIINHCKKYPCIVVWVPFNEAWGQFETEEIVALTKSLDPTRLVNMASGGNWISGGVGDILDSHHYPDPKMRIWDTELVNVLGEYGGIGLVLPGHTWVNEKNWGYVKLGSSEEATAKYEEFAKQLIPLVKKGCSAAVYTQTTDVERELNGFLTYDRKVDKLIPERVAAANRAVIESMK